MMQMFETYLNSRFQPWAGHSKEYLEQADHLADTAALFPEWRHEDREARKIE